MDTNLSAGSDIVDLESCVRHGNEPRPGAKYRIKVGNDRMEYQEQTISDPTPTGLQVLDAAGLHPAQEYLLFAVLKSGMLEEIRLDETVNIFGRGVEKFLAFQGDRSFRFILDDRRFEWGAPAILGRVLKLLTGLDTATHAVWLERRDHADRLIADEEAVSLASDAVKRFRTGPIFHLCIEDKTYPWSKPVIKMEEIAGLGGWDPKDGVIQVDKDQNERQLAPGEVVTLKPGFAYGKRLCWRRG